MVYGAKIAYSSGDIEFGNGSDNRLESIYDVKGRLGYASGRALWYSALGWAKPERRLQNPAITNNPVPADGLSYGLGVDVVVSDRLFLGEELMRRNLDIEEGEVGGFNTISFDHDVNSLSLWLGFRF